MVTFLAITTAVFFLYAAILADRLRRKALELQAQMDINKINEDTINDLLKQLENMEVNLNNYLREKCNYTAISLQILLHSEVSRLEAVKDELVELEDYESAKIVSQYIETAKKYANYKFDY